MRVVKDDDVEKVVASLLRENHPIVSKLTSPLPRSKLWTTVSSNDPSAHFRGEWSQSLQLGQSRNAL